MFCDDADGDELVDIPLKPFGRARGLLAPRRFVLDKMLGVAAQHAGAELCTGVTFERWYQAELKKQPRLLMLSKDELMRHEAAGITTQAFPKVLRLGGVDCAATYLHEPGDPKDGLSVTVPLFVLNQIQ